MPSLERGECECGRQCEQLYQIYLEERTPEHRCCACNYRVKGDRWKELGLPLFLCPDCGPGVVVERNATIETMTQRISFLHTLISEQRDLVDVQRDIIDLLDERMSDFHRQFPQLKKLRKRKRASK